MSKGKQKQRDRKKNREARWAKRPSRRRDPIYDRFNHPIGQSLSIEGIDAIMQRLDDNHPYRVEPELLKP